jgi:hypothetical protein
MRERSRSKSKRLSVARPHVGMISVASRRSRVDLPAPFAPISATASPAPTEKETPERALSVGFATGWSNARDLESAGGKYFSMDPTAITRESVTRPVIPALAERIQFRH